MNSTRTRQNIRRKKKNGVMSGLKRAYRRRPKPLWMVVIIHIIVLGLALVVFAFFHHARSFERTSTGIVTERNVPQNVPIVTEAPESMMPDSESDAVVAEAAAPVSTAEPTSVGDFSTKFADKFVDGAPVITEKGYVGNNINISISDYVIPGSGSKADIRYYVADIYVRDVTCLRSAFAKDTFGQNITENISKVSVRNESVLTMNGDFCGLREGGCCLRNGVLYVSDEVVRDICVMYWDGRIECFSKDEFDCAKAVNDGAYQIWNFGPAMLDENGKRKDNYDEAAYDGDVIKNQPRAALGYYEPGHYCFVVVDGRSERSRGMSLSQFANLAEELQLTQLYNLDGGRTAQLAFCASQYNDPGTGTRNCSDYICIVDSVKK